MAYNRWLSGSQYYQPTDVLHYGRKGMKWGKHIFGIDPNLFRKLSFGPKFDTQSLQTLLQRGEIGFNTFKEMLNKQNLINELTWQIKSQSQTSSSNRNVASKPAQSAVKRSSETMKNVADSVANNVKERKAQEDKYRRIAEDKAKMARESEEQRQRSVEAAKERTRNNAKNSSILDADKSAGSSARKTVNNSKSTNKELIKPAVSGSKDLTPSQPKAYSIEDKDAETVYRDLIKEYLNSAKSAHREESQKDLEESQKILAEQRNKEIRETWSKRLKAIGKIAKFLNRVARTMNWGV